MKKLSKNITYWLGVVAVGLVVGLSLQFVRAWTEPSVAPPGGNVGAPINVSGTGQSKGGMILVNTNGAYTYGLDSVGYVKGRTGLCIGGDCRTVWPSGAGGVTSVTGSNGITASPTTGAVGVSLTYPSKSCAAGQAIQSFTLGASTAPTCVAVGGGGLTGSGTTNYVSKWTGSTSLGNSQIYDNGSNVGIGTASPAWKLDVVTDIAVSGTDALRRDGANAYLFPWGTGYSGNKVFVGGGTTTSMIVTGTLATNGLSNTLPNNWGGIHTYDVHARNSIRTHNLCLGGGFNGDGVGDCRSKWPGTGVSSCYDIDICATPNDFRWFTCDYANGYVQVGMYIKPNNTDRQICSMRCCRLN